MERALHISQGNTTNQHPEVTTPIAPPSSSQYYNYDYYDHNYSDLKALNCSVITDDLICMNDTDYVADIHDYVLPMTVEWFIIVMNLVVLIIGLMGNFLVCYVVYKNVTMQSVTNIFIVNLAIADFCVLLFCLPPTVVWNVSETWFFGEWMCKLILYFQVSSWNIISSI